MNAENAEKNALRKTEKKEIADATGRDSVEAEPIAQSHGDCGFTVQGLREELARMESPTGPDGLVSPAG